MCVLPRSTYTQQQTFLQTRVCGAPKRAYPKAIARPRLQGLVSAAPADSEMRSNSEILYGSARRLPRLLLTVRRTMLINIGGIHMYIYLPEISGAISGTTNRQGVKLRQRVMRQWPAAGVYAIRQVLVRWLGSRVRCRLA